jgi:hypothetical protein
MNADGSEQVRLTNFDADITPSNVNVTKATSSPNRDSHRIPSAGDASGECAWPPRGLHDECRRDRCSDPDHLLRGSRLQRIPELGQVRNGLVR